MINIVFISAPRFKSFPHDYVCISQVLRYVRMMSNPTYAHQYRNGKGGNRRTNSRETHQCPLYEATTKKRNHQIKKISKGPKKHQTEETKEPLAKIDVDELDVAPCNPRWQRNTDAYFKQDDGRKKKPRCNVLISGFPFLLFFFRRRARQHSVWHDVAVVTIMLLDRGPSGGQCPVSVGDMSATWVPTQKCPSLGELLEGVMGCDGHVWTNEY